MSMSRRTTAALTAVLVSLGLFVLASGSADAQALGKDYPIENGHFYRQTAGDPARVELGFRIVDEDGVPFWSEFRRLGGSDVLGYPISRRFYMDGFLCQATQRAILQWRPAEGRVQLVNVMEYLSRLGADGLLAQRRLVPPPSTNTSETARIIWLDADPRIRKVYLGTPDPMAMFGLPLSPAQTMGPATAMRFQRGVIYAWSTPQPWAGADQMSIGNAGDFVKEVRGIPESAVAPESPPPARQAATPTRAGPRPDGKIAGVATYYDDSLDGDLMANGEPYDQANPGIATSNSYPLGTRLRVTRVATGDSIAVRVTDRGAFRYPILVDLSHAAFLRLADSADGVIRVIVEPLD